MKGRKLELDHPLYNDEYFKNNKNVRARIQNKKEVTQIIQKINV